MVFQKEYIAFFIRGYDFFTRGYDIFHKGVWIFSQGVWNFSHKYGFFNKRLWLLFSNIIYFYYHSQADICICLAF